MTKYKQYFQKMLSENKQLFSNFDEIHAQFALDPKAWQKEFNNAGDEVLDVIREYENRLCRKSEGGGYAVYSTKLAEKFQEEIKKKFPLIDRIGIITTKPFNLKKIKFF